MTNDLKIAWRCRNGVRLGAKPEGVITVSNDIGHLFRLQPPQPVGDALLRLQDGADEPSLCRALGDSVRARAALYHYLGLLRRHGALVADLWSANELIGTVVPHSRSFDFSPRQKNHQTWRLSRFSYLHLYQSELVLSCTEANCSVHLQCKATTDLLYDARQPITRAPGSRDAEILAFLGNLGFLVPTDKTESDDERSWEFHDRLLHSRGRHCNDLLPHGGTYRFQDQFPSPPAIRRCHDGETITLPPITNSESRSLHAVMEARRSCREMAEMPLGLAQVAELLHRVARICDTGPISPQDLLRRPYPSAGAIHELEFYVAVGSCEGLDCGFYHYRGDIHALTRLPAGDTPARDMLGDAAAAWGRPEYPPQCLIVLTTRLPRIAWKYEGIAYKMSLMNAGVVLQSLYLVCADLGLNCAAIGSGRPHLFEAATGTSSWEETSIAEFGFGARPLSD